MKIDVRDNQIEPALKALKKLMLKEGLFQEMKRREHYEKPSVKRKRKQAQARKKLRKAMKRVSLRSDEGGGAPPPRLSGTRILLHPRGEPTVTGRYP
jgi:small subunit ribosomal protein S21